MTWEIIAAIIALAGFIISIGKIVSNNTNSFTPIETLSEQKKNVKEISDEVNDHETRITILEHR